MTETFDGWYDQLRTKTVYEESYQVNPMIKEIYDLKQGKEPTLFYDKEKVSGEEAIALAGWTKDGNYYTKDPKRLESGKFLDVAEASMKDMEEFFKMRKELTGMEPDPSLKTIPTRPDTLERKRPKMGEKPIANKYEMKDRILANKQQYKAGQKAAKQAAFAKATAMNKCR